MVIKTHLQFVLFINLENFEKETITKAHYDLPSNLKSPSLRLKYRICRIYIQYQSKFMTGNQIWRKVFQPYLANDLLLKWLQGIEDIFWLDLAGYDQAQVVRAIEVTVIVPHLFIGRACPQVGHDATCLRLQWRISLVLSKVRLITFLN